MSMIERLAELAKGATLALELERYDHGSGRLTTVVKGMRLIVADVNGEQDREFYAACNPAAIAQAAAEHAAVVAERDALKVRNGELKALVRVLANTLEVSLHSVESMQRFELCREIEDLLESVQALTPSPQSDLEEA